MKRLWILALIVGVTLNVLGCTFGISNLGRAVSAIGVFGCSYLLGIAIEGSESPREVPK